MDKSIYLTIENYLKLIQKKYKLIEKAYLFGSFARGNENPDSDIDLALASQVDSRIEPHPISKAEFDSGNPFAVEIRRTGIPINSI